MGRLKSLWSVLLCVSMVLCCMTGCAESRSTFQSIVHNGYKGTQEQWLASLVGEEMGIEDTPTAYELAKENGYSKSEKVWMKTMTGSDSWEPGLSPYQAVCSNGYTGTFAQWLESIADAPETLGHSAESEQKTAYELACEYGYQESFIEWLISVAMDQVFS